MSTEKVPIAQRLREEVEGLLAQKKEYEDEAASIDAALAETRRALSWGGNATATVARPAKAPAKEKPVAAAKPVKAGKGESPKDWVFSILKKAGKTGMDEADLAEAMLKGGYEIDLPPNELMQHIFTEGIHPLIREGLVESVGVAPNKKYRLK